VRKSLFQANTAMTAGGALYINGLPFSLDSTSFLSNVVGEFLQLFTYSPAVGGALWFSDTQSDVSSAVRGCTFSG
jgi:hypothetical protein